MKTLVKFVIANPANILVKEEQTVNKDHVLAELYKPPNDIIINLAEVLKVQPAKIHKYLKKGPTETIDAGEIIAVKKSFISTLSVRSPIKGEIKEVDLKKGTILIADILNENSHTKIAIPVNGVVKKIGKDFIETEINGHKIKGKEGKGKDRIGTIYHIKGGENSFFHFDSEVENKIVLIADLHQEETAKLDTLGAAGVICKRNSSSGDFSLLTVNEETFTDLFKRAGCKVWLRPEDKELIVIEE